MACHHLHTFSSRCYVCTFTLLIKITCTCIKYMSILPPLLHQHYDLRAKFELACVSYKLKEFALVVHSLVLPTVQHNVSSCTHACAGEHEWT